MQPKRMTKWRKGFSKWLGEHRIVITTISSLIVVASFVIKDAWGDHLKELATTIKSDQDFSNEQEYELEQKRVHDRFENTLNRLFAKVMMNKGMNPQEVKKTIDQDEEEQNILMGIYNLRALSQLNNLLSIDKPKYRNRITELNDRFDRFENWWIRSKGLDELDRDTLQRRLLQDWDALQTDISTLRSDLLNGAQSVRDWNERYYGLCKMATYVLFGLGWFLSLLSNLTGLPGAGHVGE